jgi:putative tryptophan/tyrosine transport system substrate-binding protein
MRRRDFIKVVAGSAITWPLAARAQQARQIARIGSLDVAPDNPLQAESYPVFLDELRKLGFTEGQNLIIEHRRIDEGTSKAFVGAAELIRSNVDVVVAFGPELALKAAVAASQTVPIVMIAINFDPMAGGYVSDITRPGRNITGVVSRAPELAAKQLGLLVEAFPDVKPIAALWEQASADQFDAAQSAAQSLHIELRSHKVENLPFDFDGAFRAIAQDGSRMVLVLSGPTFATQRAHIADLAMQHRLPTMFTFKYYVEAGGLMSYGVDTVPIFRRAASFVAKILRGAKPSDLPVEQPTNFEFALNLKTAKAIGVSLPTSILLRADEVIE